MIVYLTAASLKPLTFLMNNELGRLCKPHRVRKINGKPSVQQISELRFELGTPE
jgi:hypothetical protein